MTKLYDLPLKVLWIFNCNEAEMAIDFLLKDGGKYYQVKGAGIDAFSADGELKTCTTDNIDSTYYQKPSRTVYIEDASALKKIWNYWKKESGEIRYNQVLAQVKKYSKSLETPLFPVSPFSNPIENQEQTFELTSKQVFDLVFEMEALLEMKKVFKGEVSKTEVEALIKASTEGFTEETVLKITNEILRKGF